MTAHRRYLAPPFGAQSCEPPLSFLHFHIRGPPRRAYDESRELRQSIPCGGLPDRENTARIYHARQRPCPGAIAVSSASMSVSRTCGPIAQLDCEGHSCPLDRRDRPPAAGQACVLQVRHRDCAVAGIASPFPCSVSLYKQHGFWPLKSDVQSISVVGAKLHERQERIFSPLVGCNCIWVIAPPLSAFLPSQCRTKGNVFLNQQVKSYGISQRMKLRCLSRKFIQANNPTLGRDGDARRLIPVQRDVSLVVPKSIPNRQKIGWSMRSNGT